MHFNDAINLDLQKPDIIKYYNQTESGADTVDQMVGTFNVARNTRRLPMVTFYTIVNIAGINAQTEQQYENKVQNNY